MLTLNEIPSLPFRIANPPTLWCSLGWVWKFSKYFSTFKGWKIFLFLMVWKAHLEGQNFIFIFHIWGVGGWVRPKCGKFHIYFFLFFLNTSLTSSEYQMMIKPIDTKIAITQVFVTIRITLRSMDLTSIINVNLFDLSKLRCSAFLLLNIHEGC